MNNNGSCLDSDVLVLNRSFAALRVVNARRAFILLFRGAAEIIHCNGSSFESFDLDSWMDFSMKKEVDSNHDDIAHTVSRSIIVPRVVRLLSYNKTPAREIKFSRRNIIARDQNRCQYCGNKFPYSSLSIDHVMPKSRGGMTNWTNVVSACYSCNIKKGGRTPEEAGMRPLRLPTKLNKDKLFESIASHAKYKCWNHFVKKS